MCLAHQDKKDKNISKVFLLPEKISTIIYRLPVIEKGLLSVSRG
jgi:hypothetical protein